MPGCWGETAWSQRSLLKTVLRGCKGLDERGAAKTVLRLQGSELWCEAAETVLHGCKGLDE